MEKVMKGNLPVAIIGGGPVGLAAAAHLVQKGESFILFEAGATVASNILEWGHVKMFSPWQYNIDRASRELLEKSGWCRQMKIYYPQDKSWLKNTYSR